MQCISNLNRLFFFDLLKGLTDITKCGLKIRIHNFLRGNPSNRVDFHLCTESMDTNGAEHDTNHLINLSPWFNNLLLKNYTEEKMVCKIEKNL